MPFTSKEEMILLLGSHGTSLRLDDQASTTNAVNQALKYADQTIRQYTDRFYRAEDLAGNEWVKSRATIIAVNFLSRRRGNKELYEDWYHQIIDELRQIGTEIWIPDAVSFVSPSPSVRVQKVVATGGSRPLKVDQANSTGGGYPDEDFGPPWSNYYGY